jgi:glycosyltransferase involved in cell wall biosynthesis
MSNQRVELLFINFKVDSTDPVLGFAPAIIKEFSYEFSTISVLTGFYSGEKISNNVKIYSTRWVENQNLRNVMKFYYFLIKLLVRDRPRICYTHQAAPQAVLAAPIFKVMKMKNILWYASVSDSWAIRWADRIVDRLITSTKLSKPFESAKYHAIGQAIQTENIKKKIGYSKTLNPKFLNVGRLDPSKEIENILVTLKSEIMLESFTFNHFGSSTQNSGSYKKEIELIFSEEISAGQIMFNGGIQYSHLINEYAEYDIFIHSFNGSLDKVLVEALASGLPVVTTNLAYKEIFGSWAKEIDASLSEELGCFLELSQDQINEVLIRQMEILKSQHSLETFPKRVRQQFNAIS